MWWTYCRKNVLWLFMSTADAFKEMTLAEQAKSLCFCELKWQELNGFSSSSPIPVIRKKKLLTYTLMWVCLLSHKSQISHFKNLLFKSEIKKIKGLCNVPPARNEQLYHVCVREESGQVPVSLSSIHLACVFNEPHPPFCLSPFIKYFFHLAPHP